jgi:transcriptional regulator with XRE-family HTH domain
MRKEMTANQLVAHNLRRARQEWGWTQEHAALKLEQYLGVRWSPASFSIAERSADEGARKREFDANELLAFSRAFERPVAWFFTPPSNDEPEYVVCGDSEDARRIGHNELIDAVGPHGLALRDHAATLHRIATMLEMGDEAAIRQARKRKDDNG